MKGQKRNRRNERKYLRGIVFSLIFCVIALFFGIRSSNWYHEVFDYDAVSFGRIIEKEKLDIGVRGIQSGYIVDGERKKVQVDIPTEFWTMIVDDFTRFQFGMKIKYRIGRVFEGKDDFELLNRREDLGFDIILCDSDNPVKVKIRKEGFIRIQDKEFFVGEIYTKKYYEKGLELLRTEDE